MTSHMGAATRESRFDMELQAAEAVVDFEQGRPLKNEIDHP